MKLIYTLIVATFFWATFSNAQSVCMSSHLDYAFDGSYSAQAIEKGDFDNDGIIDIIEGNFTLGTNKMFFIKGNADGTFQTPTVFDIAQRPLDIKAYDFNNDGDLDIAVANQYDAELAIAFGNGDGSFQAPTIYTMSNVSPTGIEVEDFNEDGVADIVVSCLGGGFEILFGDTGTPGTYPVQNFVPTGAGARDVTVADFNQDGFFDVATSNNSENNITVVYGDGTGAFGGLEAIAAEGGTFKIVSGDFNGDSFPDVAATNETDNSLTYAINSATGFMTPTHIPTRENPNGIELGDFNNDSKLDIAIVSFVENEYSVYPGSGTGTFSFPSNYVAIGTPRNLVIYDCNNDGNDDAVVSTNIGGVLPVFYGDGSGDFLHVNNTYAVGSGAKNLDTADVNLDGNLDILVANSSDNTIRLLTGAGDGTFSFGGDFTTDVEPRDVITGDINNDGYPDAVSVNYIAENISVFTGDGTGAFTNAGSFPCGVTPAYMAMGDVDGDGNLDVVVLNNSSQNFSVLNGDGTGSFSAPTTYASGNDASGIILADFNANSYLDVGFTTRGNNKFNVSLNSGTGTFGAISNYSVGTAPTGLDYGDFNADGNIDIAIANYNTNNFTRLIGNGTGAFSTPSNFGSGDSNPSGVVVADFDQDGNDDILGSCTNGTATTGYAPVFLSDGELAAGFTYFEHFATERGARGIVVGDFNNNGQMDIAVVNEVSKNVTVLINKNPVITADGPTTFCSNEAVNLISTPAGSYDWNSGETTQSINPTTSGNYFVTTTLGMSGQCTSSSNTITVTVEQSPALSLTADHSICSGQSSTLDATGADTYEWSTGETTSSISVTPTATTTYYLTGYSTSGCETLDSVTVTVTAGADATFSGLDASYCQNDPDATLVPNEPGGTFSGTAVSGDLFQPSMAPSGTATITYILDLGGGCADTTSQTTDVYASPDASFSGLLADYCITSGGSGLDPAEIGGAFSGTGVSGEVFYPADAGVGAHNVTYTITNASGCTSNNIQSTTVHDLPTVSFTGLDAEYCAVNQNDTLTGDPVGGTFSGAGVSGSYFNPSLAGVGTHDITYTYSDAYGCSNSSMQSTTVNAAPSANFTGLEPGYCVDSPTATLVPDEPGGTFSGTGVSADTFDPSTAGAGVHQVTYTIDDGAGCTNYLTLETEVGDYQSADFIGLDLEYCAINIDDTLIPTNSGGVFFGPGMTDSLFNPQNAGEGTHTITYEYTSPYGCVSETSQIVDVVPAASAAFTGLETDYCLDSPGSSLIPENSGGTFTGTGYNGVGFDPALAGVGTWDITYTITDVNGCTNAETQTTTVHDYPTVSFTGLSNSYCQEDAPTDLVGSPSGGTFSGDGINGTQFDPSIASLGTSLVTYYYTDAYGCSNSVIDSTEVLELADASFQPLNSHYCIYDPEVPLNPTVSGGTFFGSGVVSESLYPSFAGEGLITISYEVISADGCVSTSSQSTNVYNHPDTTVTIIDETITSNATAEGVSYQWIDCSTNEPIIGATNQSFSPTADGYYQVEVSNGFCPERSNCYFVATSSLKEVEGLTFKYYPNPTRNEVTIEIEEQVRLNLYDNAGRIVLTKELQKGKNVIQSLYQFEVGVYRIELTGSQPYLPQSLMISQ